MASDRPTLSVNHIVQRTPWIAVVAVVIAMAAWVVLRPDAIGLPEIRPGRAGQDLNNWLVLGPFRPDGEGSPLSAPCVAGKPDGALAASDLLAASGGGESPKTPSYIQAPGFVRFSDHLGKTAATASDGHQDVYYAACLLRSVRPNVQYLMLASDSPVQVYLNSRLVMERTLERGFRRWDNSCRLYLKRGQNLLVVKMAKTATTTGSFALRLEPTASAATRTALAHEGLTVSRPLITDQSPFTFRIRGVPFDAPLTASIFATDGRLTNRLPSVSNRATSFHVRSEAGATGLFTIRVNFDGQTYDYPIIVGDPSPVAAAIGKRLSAHATPDDVRPTIEALQHRVGLLLAHAQPTNVEWQHKVVFALAMLDFITQRLETESAPLTGLRGLQLRGFQSPLDGTSQHYRLYVPRQKNPPAEGWPLVVLLPTPVQANRRFLDSIFVARQFEAEALAALAERQGIALLWSGYRSRPLGIPTDLTHLDEVLELVAREQRIDPSRIHLLGSCAGAVFAMQAVEEWPRRFASVGLLNPAFRSIRPRARNEQVLEGPEYRSWRKANDPINRFLREHRDIPLAIVHDGMAEAGHGEREEALSFFAEAKTAGIPVEFHEVPAAPAIHYHIAGWENLVERLRGLRDPAYSPLRKSGSPSSIWQAVASPFVLVTGSGGTEADQRQIRAAQAAFKEAWRETHFGECRSMTDEEVTETAMRSTNLVLIGNERTNRVWRRLVRPADLDLAPDHVVVHGRRIAGENLSLQAVLRNPLDATRQIVVLGASDPSRMTFGAMDLSDCGWFDYAAWSAEEGEATLVDVGNYTERL